MKKYTKALGLFLLILGAVYSGHAGHAGAATPSIPNKAVSTDVKVLEDGSGENDPFASSAEPTTKPVGEGQSVSSSDVLVNDSGTVEIHVNDASLVEVLRMLSLQSQKNIIASNNVHGTITANLYGVTVREALDAILHANGYAYQEKGNFIFVYTIKEVAEMDKAARVMTTEVFHLYYTPAANAANMIKPVLSTDAQVSLTTPAIAGLETGTGDVGGGSHAVEDLLVVTDYAENLDRVRKILKDVDRRPQQILIEATILRATLTEDNALGVDFTLMGGVDFSTLTGAGTTTTAALNGSLINQPGTGGITDAGYRGAGTSFTQNVPQGGLHMGIVHDNIAVFLSALESVTDTTILANPKVLALNKQKGEVIVGRKDGYITTTVTQTSQTQTVEFLDTGTRLIFRPFIGDDGYVRMEIHPEDSSGGLTSANLPFKVTTEVTSNVMVKDGHTIVIGGLFRESSDVTRAQTPFLGNLPLAGYLFRSQKDHTQREEVIILLTPHVIKDDVAYSKLSEEQLRAANRLRVGVRNGMMPFGRERLAEMYYQWAVTDMNKPEPDRKAALYNLNCATNLNPLFSEAIDMKQQISGKELTSVTNCSIYDFVREATIKDVAPPTTMPSNVALPTTQPIAISAPATQPAVAIANESNPTASATQPVAEIPTTHPVAQAIATTQPSLVEAVEVPATQAVVAKAVNPLAAMPWLAVVNSNPTTKSTVVTELATEESGNSPTTQPTIANSVTWKSFATPAAMFVDGAVNCVTAVRECTCGTMNNKNVADKPQTKEETPTAVTGFPIELPEKSESQH